MAQGFSRGYIQIDSTEPVATNVRVVYVDKDEKGEERRTDISNCVRGLTFTARVGEPVAVNLDCIMVAGRVNAELEHLNATWVGPTRLSRLTWRLRRWWRRGVKPREISSVASRYREYV